jgi:hypothetical protein
MSKGCENQRMQQLVRKSDGELSFEVIGKMETPCPTPLSAMRELAVDGHSFVAAYVNFKSRLLKPLATREMGPDFWTTRPTDMLQA